MQTDMTSEMFFTFYLNRTGSEPDAFAFGFDTLPRQGHHGESVRSAVQRTDSRAAVQARLSLSGLHISARSRTATCIHASGQTTLFRSKPMAEESLK
jgi:hypothetical protein